MQRQETAAVGRDRVVREHRSVIAVHKEMKNEQSTASNFPSTQTPTVSQQAGLYTGTGVGAVALP